MKFENLELKLTPEQLEEIRKIEKRAQKKLSKNKKRKNKEKSILQCQEKKTL